VQHQPVRELRERQMEEEQRQLGEREGQQELLRGLGEPV
jgi:hypothetical protein